MSQTKFDLYKSGKIIPKIKKEKPKKVDNFYIRFVPAGQRMEISKDLWDVCFEDIKSIRFSKVNKDSNGNDVDWVFVRGYKSEVYVKNMDDAHKVLTIKRTDRKYLNLNHDTFDALNERLNKKQGGVISRIYKVTNDNIEVSENMLLIDFNFKKNWVSSSRGRKDKSK